MTKGSSLFIL